MYLVHHGIKGQKWGVRRFQNEDRTWTAEGKIRYGNDNKPKEKIHLIKDTIKETKSLKSELRTYLGNKTGHYARNEHNVDLPKNDADAKKKGWIKLTDEQSAMHQNSKEGGVNNTKWISQDGHREVVFTGKGKNQHITSDVRDEGTYNYANPVENPLGHTVYDVLPYIFLGNDANDPTTTAGRLYVSAANFLDKDVNFDPEKMSKGKKAVYDLIMVHADIYSEELYHHGILGQKWGIRRFQNEDGTLTPEGKKRYAKKILKNGFSQEEIQKFKKMRSNLNNLNDEAWAEVSKDLDYKKLNNEKFNAYIDKQGDNPNIWAYGNDQKIITDLFPNAKKAIRKYSDANVDYNQELEAMGAELVKEVGKKNERQIYDRIRREIDSLYSPSLYTNSDKDSSFDSQVTSFLDAIQEGYEVETYIDHYLNRKRSKQ